MEICKSTGTITLSASGAGVSSSTYVYRWTPFGRQALGFCEQHNLTHAWASDPAPVWPGPTLRYLRHDDSNRSRIAAVARVATL